MRAPIVKRARDVAELRTWIVAELDLVRPLGAVLWEVLMQSRALGRQAPTDRIAEQRRMAEATLYYVPLASVEALEEASRAVPADLTLSPWQVPSEAGFAVFEQPIYGLDADTGNKTVTVHGLLWGPCTVYDEDRGRSVDVLGLTCWTARSNESDTPDNAPTADFMDGWWVPLGRSDWEWSTAVVEYPPIYERIGHSIKESASEDRRLACALWGLILARPEPEMDYDRAAARRAQRAGIKAPANVRVVSVPSVPASHDGAPTGRHQHVRYVVKGHWRNQACGPKRQDHRYIYIAAHWRGPEDAPLSNPATVVKQLRG